MYKLRQHLGFPKIEFADGYQSDNCRQIYGI